MSTRKRIDRNSPEAKTFFEEILGGTFLTEGIMVAFPLCLPGATVPIPADESHITALDVTPDGTVYGGTSGRLTHLFAGMFHGSTGAVFDMGAVEGADHCAAICCGQTKFAACVNGPRGGRVIVRQLQRVPFDLIQEWGFSRQPFEDLGEVVKGEKVAHAVADITRKYVIGTTERHLFSVNLESSTVGIIGEISGAGKVAVGSNGNIFGLDDKNSLWRYAPSDGTLSRHAITLPQGSWKTVPLIWAKSPANGTLYTADGDGRLFSFTEEAGFSAPLANAALTPVGPMAVTLDGRVFGACGKGISKFFCYNPATREISTMGGAVSVIERRRYGYEFGDAVVGRDGELMFGEDDDLGHLWLYFPKIQKRSA
jgi:hypothetical protein